MADDIPEHELNEWLKTLFFALERRECVCWDQL